MDSEQWKGAVHINMEYNKSVCDMKVGDEVEGFYILKEAYERYQRPESPF